MCFPLLKKVELFPGLQHLLVDLSAVLTSGLGVQPKTLELKELLCISGADVRDPVFILSAPVVRHVILAFTEVLAFNWGVKSTCVVLPRPVLVT